MYQAARLATLNAPPSEVWPMIADFHGLYRFHPLISDTRKENHGLWRRDMFKDLDAGSLEERLHFSDKAMCYSYRSINAGGGFWPIDAYYGKFKLWPRDGGRTGILWGAQLVPSDPEDVARNEAMVPEMIENEEQGLGGLIEMFGGSWLEPEPHDYAAVAIGHFDADPESLWALVGDYYAIGEWIPNVAKVERVSNGRRYVHIAGGNQIDAEDEVLRDDTKRIYSYSSRLEPASAYPCDDYIANIKVWPREGGGSGMSWSGQFTPSHPEDRAQTAMVAGMMQEEYSKSLQKLAVRFGGRVI